MNESALVAGGAFWLGILTSISPCLLATNIAAISFLARKLDTPRYVLLSSGFYAAGQAAAFVLLATLIVGSLVSAPVVSLWLQKYLFRLLGPLLIVVAMFLFELLEVQLGSGGLKEKVQRWAGGGGLWAAALLGIVFAMSFCPTTAALFFGSLIPLAIAHESRLFLPFMYALGVALPVLAISVLIATAAHEIGRVFNRVTQVEWWARRTTGLIFFVVGVYFTLAYTIDII